MPLSEFLRQRLQAYTDNTVPALLITGGSVLMGWLIHTYGPVWGLDPKVALVLAWVVALAVALGLSALLKPKDPNEVGKHRLEPRVPPINVNIENKPVFENKVDQRPINYQTQSQAQSQSNLITQNTSVSPEVECVGCYFAQNMLSQHWNRLGEVTGRPCRAALADFTSSQFLAQIRGWNLGRT